MESSRLAAQLVKNPPAMQETPVRFLGWEDPLEKGMGTHSSILACIVHGVAKSWTWLSDLHFTDHFQKWIKLSLRSPFSQKFYQTINSWPWTSDPHLLVTVTHFLHMCVNKIFASPVGILKPMRDNAVFSLAFYFSMYFSMYSSEVTLCMGQLLYCVMNQLHSTILIHLSSPTSTLWNYSLCLQNLEGFWILFLVVLEKLSAALVYYMLSRWFSQHSSSVKSKSVQVLCLNFGKGMKLPEPHFSKCMGKFYMYYKTL